MMMTTLCMYSLIYIVNLLCSDYVAIATCAAIVGGTAVAAAPAVVAAAGFGTAGIVGGSYAASWMALTGAVKVGA